LLTLNAGTDLEIGGSVRIDICRKEQFVGVISDRNAVRKFHDGKTIIEHFERGFLSFPLKHVPHHNNRLTFPLGAEVTQRVLRLASARKLSAGTRSRRGHRAATRSETCQTCTIEKKISSSCSRFT
jgi:hypothetical protein